ncbi:hypothetical protein RSJ42_13305 [Methanosarcina hadiensis]
MDNSEENKELPLSENKSYIPDRFGGRIGAIARTCKTNGIRMRSIHDNSI